MRRLVLLALMMAILAGILTTGCTVVESSEERSRRKGLITDLQFRMLVEDWDYFWLYERNSGLTQWHPWVGI